MKAQLRGTASPLGLLLLFASGAGLALGCGWYGTEHSVRFNLWHSERQFSSLPPLPFDARKKTGQDESADEDAFESSEARSKETDAIWSSAEEAAGQRDFAKARKLLHDYVERTGGDTCRYYEAPLNCSARRNSARDRLEALASLDRGATPHAVGSYLEARSAYDEWVAAADGVKDEQQPSGEGAAASAEPVSAALDKVPREPSLEDKVAYLRAAVLYRGGDDDTAADAFERLAARYTRSEKREAALFTIGVIRLHQTSCMTGEYATWAKPRADYRDESWKAAHAAFARVLKEYPRGAYASDARGWLAYLHLSVGETAEGLAEYYRMLADESDAGGREEALRSLALTRDKATDEDMARVEAILADEPRVALVYAYHDIYNVASSGGLDSEVSEEHNPYRYCKDREESPCWGSFYDWEQKEREKLEGAAQRKELARVAAFATRLMLRTNATADGGAFALRVAQADLELGEDKSARELAARALAAGPRGNERASALWVRGVAEYRLNDTAAARATFASLVAEFPDGDLTEGARRYIAMAAEDAGDLDAALEQYIALDYTEDIAYFVDVLMTPEYLASFIERHPDSRARDVLLYSLGVRYMRDHRFEAARATYARVRTSDEESGYYLSEKCEEDYPPPRCEDVKNPRGDEPKGVWTAWVLRDLKTMDEIEHLEARVSSVAGEEARAEALYQLASYLYESSPLTFYNPAAWKGGRFFAIYYDQQFRAPGEPQRMRRYMEQHEPVVRALEIYLRIAENYPNTRAARDALYTAAVAHERLSRFELYWPAQYGKGLYAGSRFVTYDDVRRTYPDYRMPAGTYGWEPLTRTVNGRAAWPAAPKPKRPTGMERARSKIARAELRVSQAWELFGAVYGGRLRGWTVRALRWALAALVAAFVLLVFRRTRRARRFLYGQLARRIRRGRARRAVRAPYAHASSYAAHVPYEWGGRVRAAASDTARGLLRLALHERGRAALALNIFTHGLLTLLLWSLLWAAQ